MIKYYGTYRVSYEFDTSGKPCEFTFIPCTIKKGANIYRYSTDKLCVYIPSIRIGKSILKEHSDIFKAHLWGDFEVVLIFDEKNIKLAEPILKIYKKGCNISPKSKRNLKFKTTGDF